ncbi:small multidrug resistance pump [Chitinophaga sp. YR573]|uniref:DMT family transporter n=1 Tax=Chitinophaga sp. YR573 TaxID=1881040 RepID=UPI0008D7F784|nr:multidrug efflux SMR transporter [Chitinophaga sp. YR573]SEW45627.1 small multidrug resistance pump [Chitinophaga sp. YR573]
MKWIYLLSSILLEVTATTLLKVSAGNTKWGFTILSMLLYVVCFWLMGYAMKLFSLSIVYPIWASLGMVATAIIGFIFYKEPITGLKIVSMLVIFIGVIGLSWQPGK